MTARYICSKCGYVGNPKRYTKGSFVMELALWICFLLPGIIYSVWRLATRYDGCPECESPDMISVYSPIGQKLLREIYPNPPVSKTL
jgi:hypothetical protein